MLQATGGKGISCRGRFRHHIHYNWPPLPPTHPTPHHNKQHWRRVGARQVGLVGRRRLASSSSISRQWTPAEPPPANPWSNETQPRASIRDAVETGPATANHQAGPSPARLCPKRCGAMAATVWSVDKGSKRPRLWVRQISFSNNPPHGPQSSPGGWTRGYHFGRQMARTKAT
jgi:hypothetical protein